jgi:hypothetical protein
MPRRLDPLKAKEKKQKIVAAVLGVVFLIVVAIQGPRLWKQLHPGAAASSSSSASTTTTTPTAAAPAGAGSDATGAGSSLASSTAPAASDGQLTSFSRFVSKDPFAQQLSDRNAGAPTSPSPTAAPGGSSGRGRRPSPGRSATAPAPGTAVISVNGTLYTVAVGGDFPQATSSDPSIVPLFHLVSATAHTAKISIVGGSYSSGAATVTLRENKAVTLMNTADGTRYKLVLKPVGTAVPTTSASTATTVTVPPPASP